MVQSKIALYLFYGKELKMEKQKRISFGYTRNELNEIVIYDEQAEVVKLIYQPLLQNVQMYDIM